ncbi:MAG: hypothetical protein ACFFC1_13740 [Promethearchaeota archaeon]
MIYIAFSDFIFHIIFGTMSFLSGLVSVILGALYSGRIGKSKGHPELYKLHKWSGIITGIMVTITYIYMILPPIFSGDMITLRLHGWFATLSLIIVLIQVILSITYKKHSKIKVLHLCLGYILLGMLGFQLIFGMILVAI